MKAYKKASLLLAAIMVASAVTACSPSQQSSSGSGQSSSQGSSSSSAASSGGEVAGGDEEFTYPIQTDETLKIYANSMTLSSEVQDVSESYIHTELPKKIGVNVEWQFPVPGSDANQNLNLMLASEDLPDIMIWTLGSRAQQLIEDGYIIPLNDVIDQWAPNLKKIIEERGYEKPLKTDSGDYFGFPFLRESEWLLTYKGPIVRKDWLDNLNIDEPVTLDDWDAALRAMNKEYGAQFSFTNTHTNVIGPWSAYGVVRDFYMENGDQSAIHWGPMEDGFKQGLELMHKWYADGLIDPDFTTLVDADWRTKCANDKVSMSYTVSSQLSSIVNSAAEVGSPANWVGIHYPVAKEGDKQEINHMSNMPEGKGALITTACKNVELAARFLDWGYTEEGIKFYNYGEEGVVHTVENGVEKFTELVTNHPSGLVAASNIYTGAGDGSPTIQLVNYWKLRNSAVAADAVDIWTNSDRDGNNMIAHRMPVLNPTTDENSEQSTLYNAIKTYSDEMYYKFILGEESLDNWDNYVATLEQMGINRVLELKQAQLDRYNAR